MIYITIGILALITLFLLIYLLITRKSFHFEYGKHKIKVFTIGPILKIFVDDKIVKKDSSPQLIYGEEYTLKFGEKIMLIKCKTNKWGTKFFVDIIIDGKRYTLQKKKAA